MGQVLHGSATTTEAVRRAIQASEESVRALARRHGISPTTVQKWRKRATTADAPMGPKEARSTVLSLEEEAIIVAFRRHTLLPLGPGLDPGLSLYPPAYHPAPDPIISASLPSAPWHLSPAGHRG